MIAISNQFKSATTKKYWEKLDSLSSHKMDSPEYAKIQAEIVELLKTIRKEANTPNLPLPGLPTFPVEVSKN